MQKLKAFIINGDCLDEITEQANTPNKAKLVYYGVLENGKSFVWEQTEPYLLCFGLSKNNQAESNQANNRIEDLKKIKEKAFITFDNKFLDVYYFNTKKGLNNYLEIAEAETVFEADIKASARFLMEKKIKSSFYFLSEPTAIKDDVYYYHNPEFKPISSLENCTEIIAKNLNVVSLDIETNGNTEELYSIGLYAHTLNKDGTTIAYKRVLMLSDISGEDDYIRYYPSEVKLLEGFLAEIQTIKPHIFIGWNIINFDFDIIIRKFIQYKLPFNLGVQNQPVEWFRSKNKRDIIIKIPGRVIIDLFALMLNQPTKILPDYRLETAAKKFLGENKLIHSKSNTGRSKIEEINYLFQNRKKQLAEYNLKDCELVLRIWEKTNTLLKLIKQSEITGVYLEKMHLPSEVFDALYLPLLHRQRYAAPNVNYQAPLYIKHQMETSTERTKGVFKNVIKITMGNYLSSVITTCKIDPLGKSVAALNSQSHTKLTANNNKTSAILTTPNGSIFHKEKYFLPKIVQTIIHLKKNLPQKKHYQEACDEVIHLLISALKPVSKSHSHFYRFALIGMHQAIVDNANIISLYCKKCLQEWGFEVIFTNMQGDIYLSLNENENENELGNHLCSRLQDALTNHLQQNYQLNSNFSFSLKESFNHFFLFKNSNIATKKDKFLTTPAKTDLKCFHSSSSSSLYNVDEIPWIENNLEKFKEKWCLLAWNLQKQLIIKLLQEENPEQILKDIKADMLDKQLNNLLIFKRKMRRYKGIEKNAPDYFIASQKIKGEVPFYIEYIMTTDGPEPVDSQTHPIDYQYYLKKQLKPAALEILEHTEYEPLIEQIDTIENQLNFF